MVNRALIRWLGLVLLVSGIFYLPGIFHPPDTTMGVSNPAWIPVHLFFFIHHMLIVFGLIGLYLFLSEKAGKLGLIAFILTLASSVMFPTIDMVQVTLYPIFAEHSATQMLIDPKQAGLFGVMIVISVFVAVVGNILFGVAIIRTKVISRWAGLMFIVGWICFFIGSGSSTLSILKPAGVIVTGIGYIWSGHTIWKAKSISTSTE